MRSFPYLPPPIESGALGVEPDLVVEVNFSNLSMLLKSQSQLQFCHHEVVWDQRPGLFLQVSSDLTPCPQTQIQNIKELHLFNRFFMLTCTFRFVKWPFSSLIIESLLSLTFCDCTTFQFFVPFSYIA